MSTEDLSHYNPEGSDLRKLQLEMLDILVFVTDICDKHNIPYWIGGGTLLGAVRHGGFIPWDDDIDIELMRTDYKRLLKILKKELPDHLHLQTPSEKWSRLLFTKVVDKNSVGYPINSDDIEKCQHQGFFIDLFPEERSYRWLKTIVDFFYGRSFRRIKRGSPFHSFNHFYEFSASLILLPIGHLLKWTARGICAITKPKNIFHSYGIGNSPALNYEYMFPVSKIKFEGKEFSAPKDISMYLTDKYGNYTSIPPKSKRMTHFDRVEYF